MKSELGVFDFKEEDELPELEAGKFLGKFKNPNNDDSPALKRELLECGAFHYFLVLYLVAEEIYNFFISFPPLCLVAQKTREHISYSILTPFFYVFLEINYRKNSQLSYGCLELRS